LSGFLGCKLWKHKYTRQPETVSRSPITPAALYAHYGGCRLMNPFSGCLSPIFCPITPRIAAYPRGEPLPLRRHPARVQTFAKRKRQPEKAFCSFRLPFGVFETAVRRFSGCLANREKAA